MTSSQPGWMIYKQQMALFHRGDALWEPGPIYSYKRIKLGDVGYTRRGRFHLLFSATRPLESCQPGVDVPEDFEPLDTGPTVFGQLRSPGYLCTSTVKETGAGLDASASTAPLPESGVSFSFELTEKQGAALVTKYPIYREDIELESAFAEYTKRYYDSWVAFARDKRHGNDIKPILVSGVDMTKDFAMIAYSNHSAHLGSRITISVPVLASASASAWGTRSTQGLVHTNWGPQPHNPSSSPEVLEPDFPNATQVAATPTDHNQCVFIRYYTLRRRVLMFPKVIKAAADPDDLGPGGNHDESLPELTIQPSLDPDAGFDSRPTTYHSSSHSELELLHNVPSEEEDAFDIVAKYIFQNSEAHTALIHHGDIARGIPGTKMSQTPAVVVDGRGVGRLSYRSHQQPKITSSLQGNTTGRLSGSKDELPHDTPPLSPLSHYQGTGIGDALQQHSDEKITTYFPPPRAEPRRIPQRSYRQGSAIPDGAPGKMVMFGTTDGGYFPAELALAGQYNLLVDGNGAVFTEQNHTINLRIEWPGYNGWGAQIRTVNYQEEPKRITRAKLVKEIAKQLERFIERMKSSEIDPICAEYKVGPGGIELRHIRIASLEQVSRGSWQPHFFYSG